MPELPEVETVIQALLRTPMIGAKIDRVSVEWSRIVIGCVKKFSKSIQGAIVHTITRRGKYLVFHLHDGCYLVVHLRMSGQFFLYPQLKEKSRHVHVDFVFSNGYHLHYHDPRKFGKMEIVRDITAYFSKLGLEPLSEEFSYQAFSSLLQTKKKIKPHLLDQRVIAGLGNIYVDEALWHAKIHPEQKAFNLSSKAKKALFEAIPHVLQKGLSLKGTSLGKGLGNFHTVNGQVGEHQEHLSVFQKKGRPCLRCKEPIVKVFVSQRGTHLCPNCQVVKPDRASVPPD